MKLARPIKLWLNGTGGWRKLHNKELPNWSSSPNNLQVIRSWEDKKMRPAAHLKHIRNAYNILVRIFEGIKPLEIVRCRKERKQGVRVKWIQLIHEMVHMKTVMSYTWQVILKWLSKYHLLSNSAPQSCTVGKMWILNDMKLCITKFLLSSMKQLVDQFVSYSIPLFKLQQWTVFCTVLIFRWQKFPPHTLIL